MKDYILELDKPRELRYGFKALRMIRQKFGDRNLDQLQNIKMDEIPSLAWAGLKWADSALTVERVEDMLDEAIPKKYTIMAVTTMILEALAAQMGVEIPSPLKKALAGEPAEKAAEKTSRPQPKKTIPSTKKQKK
jgi:hypothetical protein